MYFLLFLVNGKEKAKFVLDNATKPIMLHLHHDCSKNVSTLQLAVVVDKSIENQTGNNSTCSNENESH